MPQNRHIPSDVGIIQPVRGKGDPEVGPDALMVLIPSVLDYLVRLTEGETVQTNGNGWVRLYRATVGSRPPLTLSGPFLGAPHAVIGMEKLIVLGAKRIWVLGWCGALQADLKIGQLLIPTGAISEEGTSAHYPISGRPIESTATLNLMLEETLKQKQLPFSKGRVWTTDALYRETPEKVKAHKKSGVLAVEMEMSALMTVAIFRSIAMAGLLVVSDQLVDLTWRPGFSKPALRKHSRDAGEVLLRLAGSL
ncbi:MAG: nucleoside phosphorylase [Desulfatiglandaceae bacterium]